MNLKNDYILTGPLGGPVMKPQCSLTVKNNKKLTITNRAVIMRVSLMLRSVTRRVALRPRDGDHSRFAPQRLYFFTPLGVRSVLGSVVPAPLALSAAAFPRHHHGAIIHLAALFHSTSALHETVLCIEGKYYVIILFHIGNTQLENFIIVNPD